jgi:hypothetical protein
MLRPDASPLDADVDFEGDGPLPPELQGDGQGWTYEP